MSALGFGNQRAIGVEDTKLGAAALRERVREPLNGVDADHPVDHADGGVGRRVVDPQCKADSQLADGGIQPDRPLVPPLAPGPAPPGLVGLHEVVFDAHPADREPVLVAVVHLPPGLRARDLRGQVFVGLGCESEMPFVHELRVDVFGRLFGVSTLVVLDRRPAHTFHQRRDLAPGPQLGQRAGEPSIERISERFRFRDRALGHNPGGFARSFVGDQPARQHHCGQQRDGASGDQQR